LISYRTPNKTHEINLTTEKKDEIVGEYMKRTLLSLSLLMLATACDGPQRNRMPTYINTGNGLGTPTTTTSTTNPWGTPSTTTGGTTSGSAGTTTPRPAGFENCDITPKYTAPAINYIGVCQSTLDETSIAVKTTVADSLRTCFIPTYKDASGSSTYLGQPQCFAPKENVVTMGQLYKTRAGFTSSPINGVMVMKEGALGAYFTCMDAYLLFPKSICPNGPATSPYCSQIYQQCPNGARTNGYCGQMAINDMTTKCNNFRVDNSYIDIRLKP
jgi:hypothetical protein